MTGILAAFSRRLGRGGPEREALARVKDLARAALDLPEGAALSANEIVCADPACPGTETVILVMIPGARTRALKVARPAAEVEAADILAAAADEGAG